MSFCLKWICWLLFKAIYFDISGYDSEKITMANCSTTEHLLYYGNDVKITLSHLCDWFFQGNTVSTTKYDVFTFLPKGLFEQVRDFCYIYFPNDTPSFSGPLNIYISYDSFFLFTFMLLKQKNLHLSILECAL